MSLISLLITLAIIGLLVWIILQVPMPAQIKNVIIGVAILVIVIWVLKAIGPGLGLDVRI